MPAIAHGRAWSGQLASALRGLDDCGNDCELQMTAANTYNLGNLWCTLTCRFSRNWVTSTLF